MIDCDTFERLVDDDQIVTLPRFKKAFMGLAYRNEGECFALYDKNKVVRILAKQDNMTIDEAEDLIGRWSYKGNAPAFFIKCDVEQNALPD